MKQFCSIMCTSYYFEFLFVDALLSNIYSMDLLWSLNHFSSWFPPHPQLKNNFFSTAIYHGFFLINIMTLICLVPILFISSKTSFLFCLKMLIQILESLFFIDWRAADNQLPVTQNEPSSNTMLNLFYFVILKKKTTL